MLVNFVCTRENEIRLPRERDADAPNPKALGPDSSRRDTQNVGSLVQASAKQANFD